MLQDKLKIFFMECLVRLWDFGKFLTLLWKKKNEFILFEVNKQFKCNECNGIELGWPAPL